ncbi:MAG: hypothetical protein WCV90_09185 [Candidatus Woesearchaeota archaeon]|jgi:hypothetical protein
MESLTEETIDLSSKSKAKGRSKLGLALKLAGGAVVGGGILNWANSDDKLKYIRQDTPDEKRIKDLEKEHRKSQDSLEAEKKAIDLENKISETNKTKENLRNPPPPQAPKEDSSFDNIGKFAVAAGIGVGAKHLYDKYKKSKEKKKKENTEAKSQ